MLTAYFEFRIQREVSIGHGAWLQRNNPANSALPEVRNTRHISSGRDAPTHPKRGELRRREPKQFPKHLEGTLVEEIIATATSWRDKAILTLLARTGQRIGDWSNAGGCYGILGMSVADFDERRSFITVKLKGARDEHRVPVTDDFWPLYHHYLDEERVVTKSSAT